MSGESSGLFRPDPAAIWVDEQPDYERLAVERFAAAQAEVAELDVLARRSPVWEQLTARYARATAMFAEAAAAAALAQARARVRWVQFGPGTG